jgi:hypothetical protein
VDSCPLCRERNTRSEGLRKSHIRWAGKPPWLGFPVPIAHLPIPVPHIQLSVSCLLSLCLSFRYGLDAAAD